MQAGVQPWVDLTPRMQQIIRTSKSGEFGRWQAGSCQDTSRTDGELLAPPHLHDVRLGEPGSLEQLSLAPVISHVHVRLWQREQKLTGYCAIRCPPALHPQLVSRSVPQETADVFPGCDGRPEPERLDRRGRDRKGGGLLLISLAADFQNPRRSVWPSSEADSPTLPPPRRRWQADNAAAALHHGRLRRPRRQREGAELHHL